MARHGKRVGSCGCPPLRFNVLPDAVVGPVESERIIYQSGGSVEHAFRSRGALEDWQREIAALCAGNSRLIFAVCTALAAPLLQIVNEESGLVRYAARDAIIIDRCPLCGQTNPMSTIHALRRFLSSVDDSH
jgi:hypothetical protein